MDPVQDIAREDARERACVHVRQKEEKLELETETECNGRKKAFQGIRQAKRAD